MTINQRLTEYLDEQDGSKKFFANIGQITAAAAFFNFGQKAAANSKIAAAMLILISLLSLGLAFFYGLRKIIIPILKVFFPNSKRFSEMETGLKAAFISKEFFIYMVTAFIYFYSTNYLFDVVVISTS